MKQDGDTSAGNEATAAFPPLLTNRQAASFLGVSTRNVPSVAQAALDAHAGRARPANSAPRSPTTRRCGFGHAAPGGSGS